MWYNDETRRYIHIQYAEQSSNFTMSNSNGNQVYSQKMKYIEAVNCTEDHFKTKHKFRPSLFDAWKAYSLICPDIGLTNFKLAGT